MPVWLLPPGRQPTQDDLHDFRAIPTFSSTLPRTPPHQPDAVRVAMPTNRLPLLHMTYLSANLRNYGPGLGICAAAVSVALTTHWALPVLSPLIIAIILGILLTNLVRLPSIVEPGIAFAARHLLRVGIVLLGLKLVISDILNLGASMVGVIVAIVAGGISGTVLLGRIMRIPPTRTLLIACGFSICGAAAVAGADSVTDSSEEDVVIAVALVVVFGTLMIPTIPILGTAFGLNQQLTGLWAGGAIHEIAQVVAAGGVIGGGALTVAVIVKLGRVLMLAPVLTILSIHERIRTGGTQSRPAIVPMFVIAFILMVIVRSALALPDWILGLGSILQVILFSAAMFGLGCSVRLRSLIRIGVRPFLLAATSTTLVATIAFVGVKLTHRI